jgi:Caspase domain
MKRRTLRLRAWEPCFLIAALLVFTACGPAFAEKRVALVVGNSAYQNVTRLDNPKNDARLMADALVSLGFTLIGGGPQLDLDEAGFRRALQEFSSKLQGADVGLFYFAGHGVQVRGSNFLIPIDANPTRESDVDLQMLDSNVVLRQMEGAGTKLNLVLLDACRNNPFGGRGLRATSAGLAQMRAPEGTLISFATQPGNVAQDGADGNSPYTKALVEVMRKPGLDVLKTFNEVGLAVGAATGGAQEPWVSFSPLKGDFYFAGAPNAAPVTGPDPCGAVADHWRSAETINTRAAFEDHLARFPNCAFAGLARARLEALNRVAVVAPPAAPVSPLQTPNAYSKAGNFACFGKADFPDSWRAEASMCVAYGCNFGKMSEEACLALGTRKRSKTVIHGNTGTTRANECWLQSSCGDLRAHGEFTFFKM